MSKKIFVHIGYPKSATTFLQNNFFNKIENINYINHNEELHENILFNDVNFQNKEDILRSIKYYEDQRDILISHEGIIGNVYLGGLNFYANCKKIFDIFGKNTKILICLRNQRDIIKSIYKYYIFCGGTSTFDRLVNPKIKQSVASYFKINVLNYFLLIQMYESFFGKKNIHIFLYEEFKENPLKIINGICSFMKCKTPEIENFESLSNPSLNYNLSINILRILNHFFLGMGKHTAPFDTYALNLRVYVRLIDKYLSKYLSSEFEIDLNKIPNISSINKSNQDLFNEYDLNREFFKFYII